MARSTPPASAGPLTPIQAWKDVLLAVALARVALRRGARAAAPVRSPSSSTASRSPSRAIVAPLRADPAGRRSTASATRAILLRAPPRPRPASARTSSAARSLVAADLAPARLALARRGRRRRRFGLVDVYAIHLDWWRGSGAVGYFRDQLGFDYHGPGRHCRRTSSTTPGTALIRRLVSTLPRPLARRTSRRRAAAAAPRTRAARAPARRGLLVASALLFTHTRSRSSASPSGSSSSRSLRRAWGPSRAAAIVARRRLRLRRLVPAHRADGALHRADRPTSTTGARARRHSGARPARSTPASPLF